MPTSSATTYSVNDSTRVRTMPRMPPRPYMIEMVSTKTLSAREPDHRAMHEADRDQVGAGRRRGRRSASAR